MYEGDESAPFRSEPAARLRGDSARGERCPRLATSNRFCSDARRLLCERHAFMPKKMPKCIATDKKTAVGQLLDKSAARPTSRLASSGVRAQLLTARLLLKADVSIHPEFALAAPAPIVGDKPALGKFDGDDLRRTDASEEDPDRKHDSAADNDLDACLGKLAPMKPHRMKEMATSSHPTTTYASFSATARLGMRKGNVWSIPPNPVATPVMLPRWTGLPRPVMVPSSDNASERPMLTAAPSEAASPTKKALKSLAVSPAAAKIGASVETEPSIARAARVAPPATQTSVGRSWMLSKLAPPSTSMKFRSHYLRDFLLLRTQGGVEAPGDRFRPRALRRLCHRLERAQTSWCIRRKSAATLQLFHQLPIWGVLLTRRRVRAEVQAGLRAGELLPAAWDKRSAREAK
jgi:hypothetical protein